MSKFEGQTAIVTGAGGGVGSAVALNLAMAGANVHLIGRRLNRLESIAIKARTFGIEATCHVADLATSSGQIEIAERLRRDVPQVDILVQNAGLHSIGSFENASVADLDTLYQINMRAPYVLTQALMPILKERHGQVVFVNSSSGVSAKPMTAQYDATKHGLRAIADSLRAEVNTHGVRVLTIYLGRTASEMQEKIFQAEGKAYQPHLLLQPDDVASVILNALSLPRTAEVTDIHIRPMIKT